MSKKVALAATIPAFVWMLFPAIELSGTEIGFEPGDPDPNLYRTTFGFGPPLPWIVAESDRQESEGRNEFRIRSFHALNLFIHIAVIAGPAWLYCRIGRKQSLRNAAQESEERLNDADT